MSQPVPEEENEALHLTEPPADEHGSELPDDEDTVGSSATQQENAETSLDEPSDDAGG